MDRNRIRDSKHYSLHINLYNCIIFFSSSSTARSLQKKDSIFTGKCIKFVFTSVLFEERATIDSSQSKLSFVIQSITAYISICISPFMNHKSQHFFSISLNARSLKKRSIFTGKFPFIQNENLIIIFIFWMHDFLKIIRSALKSQGFPPYHN